MNKPIILDAFSIGPNDNLLLAYHINRTLKACQLINSNLLRNDIQDIYNSILLKNSLMLKGRLEIDPFFPKAFKFFTEKITALPNPYCISFAKNKRRLSNEPLINFKTSDRIYWDLNLNLSTTSDVLAINENNFVADTSKFNLFILDNNKFYTPSLSSGCLMGCYRQSVLDQNYVLLNNERFPIIEKDFQPHELINKKIYLGNSLRGLIKAQLVIE